MNWFTFGFTSRKVGFVQDGSVCEGGNCEHLKEGDKAYGHSSENDSFGSEMYLMCQKCYEEFLEERQKELISCNDCSVQWPRKDLKPYTVYARVTDGERPSDCVIRLCVNCLEGKKHLDRVANDEWLKDRDHDDRNDY